MSQLLKKTLSTEHVRLARKAAYWQKGYDEWKKHGAVCPDFTLSNLITDDLLQGYMDKGWGKITEIYKEKLVYEANRKRRSESPILILEPLVLRGSDSPSRSRVVQSFEEHHLDQQELILELLGSIRKYLVKTIFSSIVKTYIKNNDNELSSFGSENITSDFDVSIIGPNANEIMWKMFVTFLAKYSDALPEAFDTNIYSSPIYIHRNKSLYLPLQCKISLPQKVDYGDRHFILLPFTDEDFEVELTWAFVKIIDHLQVTLPRLKKYIEEAKRYKQAMDLIEDKIKTNEVLREISLQTNLHPANTITTETKEIIRRYYLQYLWQEPIQKYVYSIDAKQSYIKQEITLPKKCFPEKNFFFYANIPNYFSSDAYYTSSSVATIVIEIQNKLKLNLNNRVPRIKKGIYVIAAIENLGDMITHIKRTTKELEINLEPDKNKRIEKIKIMLIKYSKYLFRIYDCLAKLDDIVFEIKAKNIKSFVLPFRKNLDLKLADYNCAFDYLYYVNDEIEPYLDSLIIIILREITFSLESISIIV
jgi:hypothetical protein